MLSRFTELEGFNQEDLQEIENSKVAVVGLGATGSVIAEHLASHGVELLVIDRDYLEESDLYSSNLYSRNQVRKGLPKAKAAEEKLLDFTDIEGKVESLKPGSIEILEEADLVMDGTDNLETRFLIDEFCRKEGIPWIYTAALAEKGYSMLFREKCFSCLFEEVKAGSLDTCEESGIMREVSSMAASLSGLKAIKLLAGKQVEEVLDVVPEGESFEIKDTGCEVCQQKSFPHLNSTRETSGVCGENKYEISRQISQDAFEKLRQHGEILADNDYLTRVSIDGRSFALFNSGRAIIEARDRGHAESIFSETLGI